jgi:hypothetical protein
VPRGGSNPLPLNWLALLTIATTSNQVWSMNFGTGGQHVATQFAQKKRLEQLSVAPAPSITTISESVNKVQAEADFFKCDFLKVLPNV